MTTSPTLRFLVLRALSRGPQTSAEIAAHCMAAGHTCGYRTLIVTLADMVLHREIEQTKSGDQALYRLTAKRATRSERLPT